MGKFSETAFIHPDSVQHGEVSVGEYSSLWPCSVIRGDFAPIKVGRFSSVQDCCVLHAAPNAPVMVGDFVTVGHGAVLHGCTVEDNCVIGMNATVIDGAVVGRGTFVAAGAVIRGNTKVPPGSLVAGVPAEVRKGRSGQEEMIKRGSISYAVLAQGYREGKDVISEQELMNKMQEMMKKADV